MDSLKESPGCMKLRQWLFWRCEMAFRTSSKLQTKLLKLFLECSRRRGLSPCPVWRYSPSKHHWHTQDQSPFWTPCICRCSTEKHYNQSRMSRCLVSWKNCTCKCFPPWSRQHQWGLRVLTTSKHCNEYKPCRNWSLPHGHQCSK